MDILSKVSSAGSKAPLSAEQIENSLFDNLKSTDSKHKEKQPAKKPSKQPRIKTIEPVIPKSIVELENDKQLEVTDSVIKDKKQKARKTKAKNAIKEIVQIVKQEQTEYPQKTIDNQTHQQNTAETNTTETTQQVIDQKAHEIVEVLQEETGIDLSNTDAQQAITETSIELENIPDGDKIEIESIEIKPTKIVDKEGKYRTKINIKANAIPSIINEIATNIVTQTKGLIKPRVCDFRVIGNTNKTQLRNANLKLSSKTVVFKPDSKKMKVNKGTRFMISVPDNSDGTDRLYVYIQESRDKTIIELQAKDFDSKQKYISFISNCVSNYYINGYRLTLNKLLMHGAENVFINILEKVAKTREYAIKQIFDTESESGEKEITAVSFKTKGTENQWLTIMIREGSEQNLFEIIAYDTITGTEWNLFENKTIQQIEKNILTVLSNAFNRDWTTELEEAADGSNLKYNYAIEKLHHRPLKKFITECWTANENNPALEIEVAGSLNANDFKRGNTSDTKLSNDYDIEAFVFRTSTLEKCIVSYYAHQFIGGDKRSGRQYINREGYHQKYSVSDKRQYQNRRNTILSKTGEERNYNSRIYIFQIEYTTKDGVSVKRRYKKLSDMIEQTGIFTLEPAHNPTETF